jgi:hypothetical protein
MVNFLNYKTILIDGLYMQYMQARCKVRFDFTAINSPYYIGGRYDPLIILTDIEVKLPVHIKKSQYKKDKGSAKVSAEYFISYDDSNLPEQEKEGSFARFVGEDPYEKLLEADVELVKNLIKNTYGVSKDQNNKIQHKIIHEDSNLIKV